MDSNSRIITLAEVKKHRRKSSVWMVIHGDVYDVTAFLEEHPGGEESLMEVAGQDGTQGFEDVGHSDDARELLKKYKIGTLPPEEKTAFIDSCSRSSSQCSMCSARSKPLEKKVEISAPPTPRAERRVQSIVVPRERCRHRRRPPPPPESSKLKWAVLALAGAIVIGFVLKKYLSK